MKVSYVEANNMCHCLYWSILKGVNCRILKVHCCQISPSGHSSEKRLLSSIIPIYAPAHDWDNRLIVIPFNTFRLVVNFTKKKRVMVSWSKNIFSLLNYFCGFGKPRNFFATNKVKQKFSWLQYYMYGNTLELKTVYWWSSTVFSFIKSMHVTARSLDWGKFWQIWIRKF